MRSTFLTIMSLFVLQQANMKTERVEPTYYRIPELEYENGIYSRPFKKNISRDGTVEGVQKLLAHLINKFSLTLDVVIDSSSREQRRALEGKKHYNSLTLNFIQHHCGVVVLNGGITVIVEDGVLYIQNSLVQFTNKKEDIKTTITIKDALKILNEKKLFRMNPDTPFSAQDLKLVWYGTLSDGVFEPYWLLRFDGEEEMYSQLLMSVRDGKISGAN